MRSLIAIAFVAGAFLGWYFTSDHYEANQAEAVRQAMKDYVSETGRGNEASGELAQAETQIVTKTVEVIKYVPQVTTGRKCLDAGAVWLLNDGAPPKLSQAAGQPVAESRPALAASDTDVAGWIAIANGQYDLCAARLNGLVDYEEGRP